MFKKVHTTHHILKEYHKFLAKIEKDERIKRIIPGRIHRKQKGSSSMFLHFSYMTQAGMKFKMSKGSTSQELFIICNNENKIALREDILITFKEYFAS